MLIQLSDGGGDLTQADIPKSLMLLQGLNPYGTQPWASPYPPLLLLLDSGIIRLAGTFTAQTSLDPISQTLRVAGLFASTIVALFTYIYLRRSSNNPITPLLSSALFLTIPALNVSPLFFFHSDMFGYPILAASLVALSARRLFVGTTLLATATIFKIHPILALPLFLIWIARNNKLRAALPSLASASAILTAGLVLPLTIPGYTQSVLSFNLSNDGNGTTIYSMLAVANHVLPSVFQTTPTTLEANQVWISATLFLYTIIIVIVWKNATRLSPIDIVLLGIVAWLIPLKIVYTHYMAWAIVPILFRGQLRLTVPALGFLQIADTLSYWSWFPNTSPVSGLDTLYGLLATSALYRSIGLLALIIVFYGIRKRASVPFGTGREPTFSETGSA